MKMTKVPKQKVAASESEELNEMVYDDAVASIRKAIDSLGAIVRRDPSDTVAKDAIANLGVVLLDLKK